MPNPLIDAVIARDGKDAYSAGLRKIQDNKAKKEAEAKQPEQPKVTEQPKQDTQRQPGMLPHSTLNDAPESVRNQLEGKPLSPQQPSSQYGQPAIPKVQPFGGGVFNADDALASKDPYRMMTDKGQPIAQVGTKKEWKDSGVVQPYEVNPYKGKAVLPYSIKELRDTYVTLQNDGRFLLDIRASKIKGVDGSRDFSVKNFKEVPQSKSQIDNYRILDSEGLSQSRKAMGKFYNVPASKLYGTPEAKAELDRRNAQVVAVKIIGLSNGDLSYNDFQTLRRDILNGRGNVYSYNVADFIASKREQKGNILADHKAQGNAMLSEMRRLQSDRQKATGKKDYYYPTNTPVPVGSMSTSDLADAHALVSMRMNRSLDMLDIVEKKARGKNGWVSNFGEGVGEGLANELVSSVSLGQGRGSDYLQKLIKRYNKGEKLNKEDSALLDAFAYSNTIDSEMVKHIPSSYKIGETTGASIPFMIDFLAANAVAGVGEIGAKVGGKITQKALQAMIRNGLIDNSRGLTRFGAKLLGGVARVATDAGVAGIMTAANPRQMGKIASNATEMLEEKPLASTSRSGAPKFGGVTLAPQETSMGKAFAKSFTDQWIENWSEMAGGWIGDIGKGAKNFGKAAVGGAFNDVKKSVPQMMAKYGDNSIGVAFSQVAKEAASIGKKAGFNDILSENVEEYFGNAARVMILGGDHTWDKEFSPEQIKETFVGLLPTMLMFGAIGGVSTAGQHATSAKQLKEYEDKLKARGIDTDKAREQMSNMSFNEYVQHEAALLTKARIKHAEAEALFVRKNAGANNAMEAAKEAEEKAMFALYFAQYQGVRGVDTEAIQEAREAHEREVDRSIDNSVKSVSHLLSQEHNPDNTPNPTAGTYSRVEHNGKEYVIRNGKFKAVAQRDMESGAPIKDRNGNVSYEVDADELLYLQDANRNVVPAYSSDVTPLGETIRLDGLKNSAKSILMSDASGGIQPSAIIDESTLRELSDPNNNLPYVQAEPSAFVSSEEVEQAQSDIAGMEPQAEQQEQVPQVVPQIEGGVDDSTEASHEEESFVLNDDEEHDQGEWDNLDDYDPNRPIEVGDDVLFDSDGRGYVKTGVVSQVSDDAYYIQAHDGGMYVIPLEQGIWHNMFNRKGWTPKEHNTQEQESGVVDTTSPEEVVAEEQQEADPQTAEEWVAYFDGDIEAAINWIENTIHVLKKDLSKLEKESKQVNAGEAPSEYKARIQESRVVIDAIRAKIEENEGILSDLQSMLAGEEADEPQEEANKSEEVNEEEESIAQPSEEEELEPEIESETTETTISPTESEEKSQKEDAESEKTEAGQESKPLQEEKSSPETESKTASEVLNEVVAENAKELEEKADVDDNKSEELPTQTKEKPTTKEVKKKGSKKELDSSVWAFTIEDPSRPMLAGVYHDGGYAVATNLYVIISDKTAYDPSKEGEIVDRKGNVLDAKFPKWRVAIPENVDSFKMDFGELVDKLREVRSKIEGEILTDRGLTRISTKIKNYASSAVISVRFPNGLDLQFELGHIELFANAAVRLRITEMWMKKDSDSYRIAAQNKNGILGCVTIRLGRKPSRESIDLENVAQEEDNIERENLKEDEKGALYHRSSPDGMVSSNDAKQRTIEHLVERLKKSGLAEDVIVDKEAFEKKLEEVDNVQFLKDGEQVYGFVSNGVVYLNPDLLNTNTPIHEFAHLWNSLIKQKEPELWNEGVGLVKDSSYMDEVRNNPYYSQLSEEDQVDEAMAMAIGDFGAKEIESNGVRGASLRAWIGKVWDKIRSFLGVPKREYKNLDDFARTALNDLLGGIKLGGKAADSGNAYRRGSAEHSENLDTINERAERDREYIMAVESGDMEKAQAMVNEEAERKGYSSSSSYQGTSAFNGSAPYGNGYFLSKEERKEAWDNEELEGDSSLGDYIDNGVDPGNIEFLISYANYRHADAMRKEAIENIRSVVQGKKRVIKMYRSVPSWVKEGSFRNGDWVTPSRRYAEDNANVHGWGDDSRIIEQEVSIDDVWFDGNDIAEFGYGREEDYTNDKDFAYRNIENNRKLLDPVTYDDNGNVIPLSKRFDSNKHDVRFHLVDKNLTEEELAIVERTKNDGSYMKAPNGADTNLTERQWLQVRTKAFKNWFGDWEKKARIEKLRKSKTVEIIGNEIDPSDDLKQYKKNALEYGKRLQGHYINKDTGRSIQLQRGRKNGGLKEVLQHDITDIVHLQSVAAIPQIVESSIYIDSEENTDVKKNPNVSKYHYYVCGLRINGVDYTVRMVEAEEKNGSRYYDHKLTHIEKGKLIDELAFYKPSPTELSSTSGLGATNRNRPTDRGETLQAPVSATKDNRLVSLLQVGEVSKVVDENGEPLVVYHGTWASRGDNYDKWYPSKEAPFYQFGESKYGGIHFGTEEQALWRISQKMDAFEWKGDYTGFDHVYESFLSIKNVLRVYDPGLEWREVISEAKSNGHDGLVYLNIHEGMYAKDSFVVFSPTQIKSATDNVGSFDGNVEDIRFRRSETPLRESDGDIFVRGQISPNLPENFQSYHFFYEPGLDYIYADPTEYYRLESIYNENGGHLPEGWEYDFNPEDFRLKEGYVCCHWSDEYEYPSMQQGAGDDSYCVFFQGEEIAEVYDGVVAHIIRPLDSWERQKDGTYKRIISDDNIRERTPEQIVSENGSAYDTLYDRAGVEQKAKSVADKLSVPTDVKVKSKHEVPRSARNTKGYYDPKSGEVVVVLENVSSREDLEKTILHEVIGHKGLDALIPEADRDAFFNGVYNLLSEEQLLPIMARYPNAGKRELAEEFIAHLAEGYVHPTLITRVSKAIRSLLRSLGFNLRLTDGEVMTLLYRGSVALKRKSATAAQEIAYINQDKAVSESMSYMDELNAMSLDELRDEVGENGVKLAQRMRLLESLGGSERLRYRTDEAFKEIEVENVDRSAVADSMNEAFTGKKVGEHKIPTWTQFLEETHDDLISLRKYQENVEKSIGKKLPSYLDIDKVFNQMSSRAAAAEELLVDIFEKEVGGVIRKLEKEKKITYRDIQLYVMAKHAIERNQVKRQKEIEKLSNPTSGDIAHIMQQDYSSELAIQYGIEKHLKGNKNPIFSNVDGIRSYIEAIENSAGKDIDALWSSINKLNGEALKMWYEAGMISKDHYNNIKKLYKYYVPLQGIDDETIEDVWTYYGVSNRGNYSLVKDAEGRNKLPDNPFMVMRKNISNTAYMAEHNKAKVVVLALAQTHPTDYLIVRNSWDVLTTDANGREEWKEVMPESEEGTVTEESMIAFEEKMQALEEEGKAKRHEHEPISNIGGYRVSNPNTLEEHLIRVSVNGKEQIVFVNGSPSFAQAVNRENRGKEREFLSKVAMVTRLKAAFATSLSIPFAFTNGVRDLLWSLSSSGIRYGKDYEMRFVRYYGRAGKFLFSPEDKQDEGMKHLWDEFKRNGGRTGYASMVGDENARKLAQKGLSRGIGKRGVAARAVNKAGNAISYLGETIEDLTRFAAYCAAREGGKSVTDSIDVAKEMTVNFNRRGKGSSLFMRSIFSFYMFINANIQGMAQLVKMFKNHPVGTSVMAVAYAMLPMFSAILTKLIGDDDDYFALSDYERTHNLIICLGSGKFIKVPMPQEMYPFLAIGNSISELAFGESSVTDALLGSVDGILDGATFGLDASSSSLKHFKRAVSKGEENPTYLLFRGFVPSILQPATDVWNNWDYVGRHIEKPSYGKNTPKYQRVYENKAWGWLVGLSKAINGDDIKGRAMQDDGIIGAINSPANAQYLIESWLGGVVSTIAKDVRFAEDLFRGENFFESASHAAVLGRFIHFDSHLQEKKMQSEFYKAKEGVDIAMKKIKEIQKGIKANEDAISLYEEEGNYTMVGILEKEIEDAEADIMEITNGKDPELYKDASDMFKDYSKEQRQLRELLNSTTDEELRSEIQEQIYNSNEEIMGYYNELLSD